MLFHYQYFFTPFNSQLIVLKKNVFLYLLFILNSIEMPYKRYNII